MEILKKGTAAKAVAWTCRCPLCETVVKIYEGDPDIIRYHNCSGSFRHEVYWKCPVCDEEVLSATGEHARSASTNLISKTQETISMKDKEMIENYPGFSRNQAGEIWWDDSSKWNANR